MLIGLFNISIVDVIVTCGRFYGVWCLFGSRSTLIYIYIMVYVHGRIGCELNRKTF